jgi:hypothetical protein
MITTLRWFQLVLRHPVRLANTVIIAGGAIIRQKLRRDIADLFPGEDPELALWELRGNWVLEELVSGYFPACVARFVQAQQRAEALPRDAYSASQRIANGLYLVRAHPPAERAVIATRLQPSMMQDALYLRENSEFRTLTPWFNNHLLNNYRAAAMIEAHRALFSDLPNMAIFADRVGSIILRNLPTLFSDDGVLLEGSVSYELQALKHLVDIACTPEAGVLAAQARGWLLDQAERVRQTYRKADRWLLPQIGDCSPDWNPETIEIFLNGFALGHDTPYRRIWCEELSALGL